MRSDRTATLPLATIAAAGATDPGRQREHNEDRFYIDAVEGIFLVVDGVGGEAAGEVAAAIAVDTILDRLARRDGPAETRIREAITLANQEILHSARIDAGRNGMACVLTLAVLEGRQLTIGHVGDSRLYKLTPQGIAKLTHDHSPVGEREDAREITETEAMQHTRRNEVYRDVGSQSREPDAADFIEIVFSELPEDSAIVLCSDGLSDMLTSLEINRIARLHAGNPERAVAALIAAANQAGGKDNITVIVAEGRDFPRHNPATPVVLPPAPDVRAVTASTPTLPLEPAGGSAQPEAAAVTAATPPAPAPTSKDGWLDRLMRSRGLALVVGTLLGLSAGLVSNIIEAPLVGRRFVVGGAAPAFTTIGAALAQARSGDSVIVEPGEYPERVDLPPGVELISRVPDAAVLVSQPSVAPWIAVTARGGPGALRGFRISGRPDGTIYIGVRLQGDGFEIDDMTFDGAVETAVEIQERAGSSVLRGNKFSVAGVPVRMGGAIAPTLRRNTFIAGGDARLPAIDVGSAGAPRLEDNVFFHFGQPLAPMRRDLSLQGNVQVPPAARR